MCVGTAQALLPFAQEVFALGFKEEPKYSRLKHHLTKVLLVHNVCPDQRFDWSKFKLPRRRPIDVQLNDKEKGGEHPVAKENVEADKQDDENMVEVDSLEPGVKELVLEQIRESRGQNRHSLSNKSGAKAHGQVSHICVQMVTHTLECNSNRQKMATVSCKSGLFSQNQPDLGNLAAGKLEPERSKGRARMLSQDESQLQ